MRHPQNTTPFTVRRLSVEDIAAVQQLNRLFADAFDDADNYLSNPPDSSYLGRVLALDSVIVLVAMNTDDLLGGLVAYELPKLEQTRSELYIYDLAVAKRYRRRGIATALISSLHGIAKDKQAHVIYVQADYGDEPAINLYTKLGTPENVWHFDLDK